MDLAGNLTLGFTFAQMPTHINVPKSAINGVSMLQYFRNENFAATHSIFTDWFKLSFALLVLATFSPAVIFAEIPVVATVGDSEAKVLSPSPSSDASASTAAKTTDDNPTESEYRLFAQSHSGDASRGKDVFKSLCASCHTVNGVGGVLGPDLAGISNKYPREKLIEEILNPSQYILDGYAGTILVTDEGRVYTGIVTRNDQSRIELFDTQGRRWKLLTKSIVERHPIRQSIMADGLEQSTSLMGFADLVAYVENLKLLTRDLPAKEGTFDRIERLKKPILIKRFHTEKVRFDRPVFMTPMPGLDGGFAILEHQTGKIWLLRKAMGNEQKSLFLDLGDQTYTGTDQGLTGIAFHPDFKNNKKYYLKHEVLEDNQLMTVVVQRQATDDYWRDSGLPPKRILTIGQPSRNHNGGTIAFGPDGYLYVGMGDGGPQRDPSGNGQSLYGFLGSILCIDVDSTDGDTPYGIPPTNPFVNHPDLKVKREIWAYGLREPWRFSFDSETGDLWVGDVGQWGFEEVTLVRAGENHGWNVYEGFAPFSNEFRDEKQTYIPPIVALSRKLCVSVTGGYVYRGTKSPTFAGVYIFGGFHSRRIWGLTHENRKLTKIREIGIAPANIASFATDCEGEIFVIGYDGSIYWINLEESVFE